MLPEHSCVSIRDIFILACCISIEQGGKLVFVYQPMALHVMFVSVYIYMECKCLLLRKLTCMMEESSISGSTPRTCLCLVGRVPCRVQINKTRERRVVKKKRIEVLLIQKRVDNQNNNNNNCQTFYLKTKVQVN